MGDRGNLDPRIKMNEFMFSVYAPDDEIMSNSNIKRYVKNISSSADALGGATIFDPKPCQPWTNNDDCILNPSR